MLISVPAVCLSAQCLIFLFHMLVQLTWIAQYPLGSVVPWWDIKQNHELMKPRIDSGAPENRN